MLRFRILTGDFNNCHLGWSCLHLKPQDSWFTHYKYNSTHVEKFEIATQENVKQIGGTVGRGVAGAVLLGPAGLLAGLLLGGRNRRVTFVVKFKNGKKLLGSADSKTFTKIQTALF